MGRGERLEGACRLDIIKGNRTKFMISAQCSLYKANSKMYRLKLMYK